MKFNFENVKKETVKIKNQEKEQSLERMKRLIKPIFAYGMYALVTLGSAESTAQHNHLSKINKESLTLLDKDNVVEGEGDFNYYSPEILKDFETFYKYANQDEGFKQSDIVKWHRFEHSEEGLNELINKLSTYKDSEKLEDKEYVNELRKQIENFALMSDEDEIFKSAMREKYQNMLRHVEDVEKQRSWLKKITASKTYLKRLIKEHDGNESRAQNLQEKRIQRLEEYNYYLSNHSYLSDEQAYGHVLNHGKMKYQAFIHNESTAGINEYTDKEGNVVLTETDNNMTALHEFEHQVDLELISTQAKEIFYNNLDTSKMPIYQFEELDYYSNPSELLARKRVFDYELEKLQVKKYDEEFTQDHYEKVLQLQQQDELDYNSEQFINSFRKDGIMIIMNTVADTIDEKVNSPHELKDAFNKNNDGLV